MGDKVGNVYVDKGNKVLAIDSAWLQYFHVVDVYAKLYKKIYVSEICVVLESVSQSGSLLVFLA